jgi:hypothetical protein
MWSWQRLPPSPGSTGQELLHRLLPWPGPAYLPAGAAACCSVLEGKLAEARSKKDTLKARAASAKTSKQIQEMVGNLNTNNSVVAFDKMEEKVRVRGYCGCCCCWGTRWCCWGVCKNGSEVQSLQGLRLGRVGLTHRRRCGRGLTGCWG